MALMCVECGSESETPYCERCWGRREALEDFTNLVERIERLEARVSELEDQPTLYEAIKQDRRDLGFFE